MKTLHVSEAVELVRKNLEELDPDASAMYPGPTEVGSFNEYGDEQSMNSLIARNLPEAINSVHMAAPVQLLEGENGVPVVGTPVIDYFRVIPDDPLDEHSSGILYFNLSSTAHYLRLVAFQADDSPIVVTDVIAEASPEGRKQLNPHIRGRADRPRLVLIQGQSGPEFKYYSITDVYDYDDDAPSPVIRRFFYVKEQFYIAPTTQVTDPGYSISPKLRQNIIDYLTAVVLATYNDQKSQFYFQKASVYPSL